MSGLTKEIFLDGMAEGKAEGKAEGIEQGKIETLIKLFKQGVIDENVVMSNLGLSRLELEAKLKEYD